jgi:malonate decarboxylase beta subunit
MTLFDTDQQSWFEASARTRLATLLDPNSFREILGPECREISPHLAIFDLPAQFDDGIVVGSGRLDGRRVLVAAQEGRFMGGSFGEVHGAKLTGLLNAAAAERCDVVIAFDTGGVRLQEANAGEVAISEIIRALLNARIAGSRVIGLIGGRAGCFGGGSLIAGCCSTLIISEEGRLSVSGPEVIETNKGVEEFDSRDRALVWRTMGGKHRYLTGTVGMFVADDASAFRKAAIEALSRPVPFDGATLQQDQKRLAARLRQFGGMDQATDIWSALGAPHAAEIPDLGTRDFLALATMLREHENDL